MKKPILYTLAALSTISVYTMDDDIGTDLPPISAGSEQIIAIFSAIKKSNSGEKLIELADNLKKSEVIRESAVKHGIISRPISSIKASLRSPLETVLSQAVLGSEEQQKTAMTLLAVYPMQSNKTPWKELDRIAKKLRNDGTLNVRATNDGILPRKHPARLKKSASQQDLIVHYVYNGLHGESLLAHAVTHGAENVVTDSDRIVREEDLPEFQRLRTLSLGESEKVALELKKHCIDKANKVSDQILAARLTPPGAR